LVWLALVEPGLVELASSEVGADLYPQVEAASVGQRTLIWYEPRGYLRFLVSLPVPFDSVVKVEASPHPKPAGVSSDYPLMVCLSGKSYAPKIAPTLLTWLTAWIHLILSSLTDSTLFAEAKLETAGTSS
jgi:hypothetical protein